MEVRMSLKCCEYWICVTAVTVIPTQPRAQPMLITDHQCSCVRHPAGGPETIRPKTKLCRRPALDICMCTDGEGGGARRSLNIMP